MSLIKPYYGRTVTVTLRLPTPVRVSGVLTDYDGTFVILEQKDGQPDLIIPIMSILQIQPG